MKNWAAAVVAIAALWAADASAAVTMKLVSLHTSYRGVGPDGPYDAPDPLAPNFTYGLNVEIEYDPSGFTPNDPLNPTHWIWTAASGLDNPVRHLSIEGWGLPAVEVDPTLVEFFILELRSFHSYYIGGADFYAQAGVTQPPGTYTPFDPWTKWEDSPEGGARLGPYESGGGYTYFMSVTGPYQVVPEPGAWALMILGFASAGSAVRRRNTQMNRA